MSNATTVTAPGRPVGGTGGAPVVAPPPSSGGGGPVIPPPASGGQPPIVPLPTVGSRTGVGKGLDAQGNFVFNGGPTMNLYSPEEWIAADGYGLRTQAAAPAAPPQAASSRNALGTPTMTGSVVPNVPQHLMTGPKNGEIGVVQGGKTTTYIYDMEGRLSRIRTQDGQETEFAPDGSILYSGEERGGGGNDPGVMGAGRDAQGNVIVAGQYSGYKVGDNASQPNRYVGSGALLDDFQNTVRANPTMTSEDVAALNKYHDDLQNAYRMGMADEQTTRAAYQILQNDAIQKSQARIATEQQTQQAQQMDTQLNAEAKITPPKTGTAGLVQPTGYLADGTAYYGRPLEEISASGTYNSPEERIFFLNSIGKTLDAAGNVVMLSQLRSPAPGTRITPPSLNGLAGTPQGSTQGSGRASWSDWGELPGGQMAQWAINNGYTADQIIYQGQNQFPPEVERWRPLVSEYFAPEDVDHALWIMQHESGGASIVQIGGGPGTGLFQVEHGGYWPGRPSQEQLLDPRTNVAYAAQMVYGSSQPQGTRTQQPMAAPSLTALPYEQHAQPPNGIPYYDDGTGDLAPMSFVDSYIGPPNDPAGMQASRGGVVYNPTIPLDPSQVQDNRYLNGDYLINPDYGSIVPRIQRGAGVILDKINPF